MRKRIKQEKFQKITDIIHGILKRRNFSPNSDKQKLQEAWSRSVGHQIAAQTRVEKCYKDILYIKVSNPIWMQQLFFLKDEIIQKLNGNIVGKPIVKIQFSVGDILLTENKHGDPNSFVPESFVLKDQEKSIIDEQLSSISDAELKEILKRVIIKDIVRRRLSGSRKAP